MTRLRPLFEPRLPPLEQASGHLAAGGSVGIFPEGTVNRNARRLLRGRHGAARLSLDSRVPVMPVGIRFGRQEAFTGNIDASSAISIRFGRALFPPMPQSVPCSVMAVFDWHATLMGEIGQLCGKRWGAAERGETGLGSGRGRAERLGHRPAG